jgi:hypothetical protein
MPHKSNTTETDEHAATVPQEQDDELEMADDDEDFEDDDDADDDTEVDEEDVEED